MRINIPDDYLKYRYIYNFVNLKECFIYGIFNDNHDCCEKILSLTSKDNSVKKNIHSEEVRHIRKDILSLSISKLFFPYENVYFFIDYKIEKNKK